MHVYLNYYKKISPDKYKKNFCQVNLSLDELRPIAQIRNISDYENKSKEDLIKALSKTKPKPETSKPDTKPKPKRKSQTPQPKPEIKPKQTSKPKPKP